MQTVHGVYDGETVRPTEAVEVRPNTRAIITFVDESPCQPFRRTTLDEVAGCLRYPGPAKTLDEMQAAVRRHMQKRWP